LERGEITPSLAGEEQINNNYINMFKDKINKIKKVTDIISTKDLKSITEDKNVTLKTNYTK
jgi:hypothetical protein